MLVPSQPNAHQSIVLASLHCVKCIHVHIESMEICGAAGTYPGTERKAGDCTLVACGWSTTGSVLSSHPLVHQAPSPMESLLEHQAGPLLHALRASNPASPSAS